MRTNVIVAEYMKNLYNQCMVRQRLPKILLLGADGQLGADLAREFGQDDLVKAAEQEFDVTVPESVRKLVMETAPGVVLNATAYNNVPDCEINTGMAFKINATGVRNIALACRETDAKLVHFSTDYVFDGEKGSAYDEEDVPSPINAYGISKLCGEYFACLAPSHCIVRLSGLFGTAGCKTKGGTNFAKKIIAIGAGTGRAEVASNIYFSPTYSVDAASKTREIMETGGTGLYHVTNAGDCSWYEFAVEILRLARIKAVVTPRDEDPSSAGVRRPACSSLTSCRIAQPRHWKDALADYIAEFSKSPKGNEESQCR